MKNLLIFFLFLTYAFQVTADDSNRLFDWAESKYPHYFSPQGTKSQRVEQYLARYYESKDIYLGTLGEDVFVYGKQFNGLLNVGKISDFIPTKNQIIGEWTGRFPNGCIETFQFNADNTWSESGVDRIVSGTYILGYESENALGQDHVLALTVTTDNGLKDCTGLREQDSRGESTAYITFAEDGSLEIIYLILGLTKK